MTDLKRRTVGINRTQQYRRIGSIRFGDGEFSIAKRTGYPVGKLFENRPQANGVDNLTNAMFRIEEEGIPIVFSVHDEPVMEVPLDWKAELYAPDHKKKAERTKSAGVKFIEALMCEEQPGFKGLPLSADGMDAMFYQK